MIGLKYRGLVVVLALCAVAAGCSTDFPDTEPAPPEPPTITEPPFTGTLTRNGGITQPFVVTNSGTASVTITALADDNGPAPIGPDGTIRVGLQLGTWNGTVCQLVLANDNAFVATVITAAVTSAGPLCARINDDDGNLPSPVTFEIKIEHS